MDVEIEYAKQPHKPGSLIIALTLAVFIGLGLVSLSNTAKENYPYSVTGQSVREVGKAPTTTEYLEGCNDIYTSHLDYCDVTFESRDEFNLEDDCYKEAKQNCFDCVLSSKSPTNEHLTIYCLK